MSWEKYEPIIRPNMNQVHMGVMKVDESKCNKCGLCMENCPFRAWEKDVNDIPVMKEKYECFSCYNCKVACPNDAISIVDPYHVDDGFWKTEDLPLPATMPLEPKDEFGNPTEWNAIEKAVFQRRSVRNFKDKPVPDSLLQRVIEAGRFAPSAGNCQPWRFIVITDPVMIDKINKGVYKLLSSLYNIYLDNEMAKNLGGVAENEGVGTFDPRVILGGMGSVTREGGLSVSLGAPAVILILGDERAISGAELNIGICGQNMNLVANSLGIKACWNGFISRFLNSIKPLQRKLGIKKPWKCVTSLCLGYPKFKQEGIVPREDRPVTWFREEKADSEAQQQDITAKEQA